MKPTHSMEPGTTVPAAQTKEKEAGRKKSEPGDSVARGPDRENPPPTEKTQFLGLAIPLNA
jgi:hypothetical protein